MNGNFVVLCPLSSRLSDFSSSSSASLTSECLSALTSTSPRILNSRSWLIRITNWKSAFGEKYRLQCSRSIQFLHSSFPRPASSHRKEMDLYFHTKRMSYQSSSPVKNYTQRKTWISIVNDTPSGSTMTICPQANLFLWKITWKFVLFGVAHPTLCFWNVLVRFSVQFKPDWNPWDSWVWTALCRSEIISLQNGNIDPRKTLEKDSTFCCRKH